MINEIKSQTELEQVSGGMVDVASIFASLSTRNRAPSTSTSAPSNEPRSTNTSSFNNSFGRSSTNRAIASDSSTGESFLSLFGNARGFNGFR